METKRLDYIDFVKGISILLVVLGHILPEQNEVSIWIYSFHLPLFFIISGYLFGYKDKWKEKTLKENVKNIAVKIPYPYITFSLISIVLVFIKDIITHENDTIYYIKDTILFEGYGPMWFLIALFIGELIFVIINRNKSKVKIYSTYIIIFLFTIFLTYIINYIRDANIIVINENFTNALIYCFNIIDRSLISSIFIYVGYVLYNILNNVKYDRVLLLVISIFVIFINIFVSQINAGIDLHFSKLNNIFTYYIVAISTSVSIIILAKDLLKHNKLIQFFGKNSLIIMATHWNFQILYICRNIIKLEDFNNGHIILYWVLSFLFIMIVESILILIINKYFPFLLKYKNEKRKE